MEPSHEVAHFEVIMRIRKLRADLLCPLLRIRMQIDEVLPKLEAAAIMCEGILFAWEVEKRDAWIAAQRDPAAWIDRLVLA